MVPKTETPDVHSSSPEYATRFRGHAGQFFLQRQTEAVEELIGTSRELSVLDVGGGHGQLLSLFHMRGCHVTVLGSDETTERHLRLRSEGQAVNYVNGNLIDLPFLESSFDLVISTRILSHVEAWKHFLSELCRVAKRTVIVDYPGWCSLNALTPLLFPLKKGVEGNTRPYRSFFESSLDNVLRDSNFATTKTAKQLLLPMFVHRALDSPEWLQALEHAFSAVHLTALFGSPVVLRADRLEG